MEKTNDGFKLAELDMQLRGPGEILGLKQSGASDIPVNILNNVKFLNKVQLAAKEIINNKDLLNSLQQNLLANKTDILI